MTTYHSKVKPGSSGVFVIPASAEGEPASEVEYAGERYARVGMYSFDPDDPHPGGLYLLATGDERMDLMGKAVRFYLVRKIN